MIPLLLWRCPLCTANDALVHVERLFRPDLVRCRSCAARWRVRRVPGDNFYLELIEADRGAGDERTITAWYDAMKRTVRLVPIDDPAVSLETDETLYLASGMVELQAEESDPSFFPGAPDATRMDKREIEGRLVGRGRLFLTNQRLIWQGDGSHRCFPLSRVSSAYALLNYGLTLLVEMRLYTVYFLQESPLKWVTYLALVARQVQAETGHLIATSHF